MSVFNVSINGLNGNPEEVVGFIASWLRSSEYAVTEVSLKVTARASSVTPQPPAPLQDNHAVATHDAESSSTYPYSHASKYTVQHLRDFAKQQGLNISQLAKTLGVARSTVSNFIHHYDPQHALPPSWQSRFHQLLQNATHTTNDSKQPTDCDSTYLTCADMWHFRRNVTLVDSKSGQYKSLSQEHLAYLMSLLGNATFKQTHISGCERKRNSNKFLPHKVEVAFRTVIAHILERTANKEYVVTTNYIPQDTLTRLGIQSQSVGEEILEGLTEFAEDLEKNNLNGYKVTTCV